MSEFPFGFNPGPGGEQGPADLAAAFTQLGRLLSWQGGPVNWDLARDVARQVSAQSPDPSVGTADREPLLEAWRLAELWLDDACAFPSAGPRVSAWSRAEWIEATIPAWQELVEPVAAKVVDSLGTLLSGQGSDNPLQRLGLPVEQVQAFAAMAGPLQQVMRTLGGAMFGTQVGQAIGSLSTEVLGSTDVGIPLAAPGTAALLPANIAAFGAGLGIPDDQIRLYLALREAAHQRLFAHAPWLRSHLVGAVGAYARGITVDVARLEGLVGQIDPADPASLQEAMSSGMLEPEDTPEQRAALQRLETALALVEGWVDEVVDGAAAAHLPSAGALRETMRRRRATGGPAEQTFSSLVGLELRPRRLRDAAALWRSVLEQRCQSGREAVWAHPDLLPGADDLDDPAGFAARPALGGDGTWDLAGLDDSPAPPEDPEEGTRQ